MTPRYGSAIDGPGGDPVAVVNLLEPSVAVGEDILYGCCVSGGIIGVGFERLDHSSDAARCDACGNEGVRIVQRQQDRFNADAASKEQIAQVEDPVLALITARSRRMLPIPIQCSLQHELSAARAIHDHY
jgi:hypothetical protein